VPIKEYIMYTQTQSRILSHYQRLVNQYHILGSLYNIKRMKRAITEGYLRCWKCDDKIDINTIVKSMRGNYYSKIYHPDCYHEY
jgi:hypothetical protein